MRPFAGGEIGAERQRDALRPVRDLEPQRRAGVIVPDFDRIDAVPMRALAARQQEVDCRRRRAVIADGVGIAKCLAEVPAFGMRPQVEKPDHVVGSEALGSHAAPDSAGCGPWARLAR